ncbi:MAG: ParB/RepB/Spo0J family partition protein [Gemmatimonadetes bacterium]|nr:ParB/RepB/Spo0J family partition protein [Gemmatimonadota bacterium]
MSSDDRRLGKGLAALLSENLDETPAAPEASVALERIRPNPFQPRAEFDEDALGELADSIRENGLLQPIVVRPVGEVFQIVAGERRFRAIERLGWDEAPVITRGLTDEQMLVVALVENLQRENLSAIDEARGYRQLIDAFGLTQEDVGRHVGRDRSTVSNALRLLTLPVAVQRLVAGGTLSAGHARAILRAPDPGLQLELAEAAVAGRWSVRETEQKARAATPGKEASPRSVAPSRATDPVARRAELALERSLGTHVRIRARSSGSGEFVIPFRDHDDFMRLVELIAGEAVAAELRG